ncbi:peptidoglycan DD-metalloendopeptidase family protein [Helicobacter anatolicus]|uniref:peptidoglycan DD-metalloendopeptidase family protein n=1 Tax=Helicobacter anatolicus TaxID=2905874 RepID=UPI001E5AEC3D|nr:peptidoglycan DD-metalloendopeptidase family protein [Helicobacter anatolicus]MCE3038872.1 peptidoglycan DD-metalloendopeptidase family protein [Helicobacter anatolicus]
MKKFFFVFLFVLTFCFGAVGERLVWNSGLSLLAFLEQNKLPLKLYYNLSNTDKELASEVRVGSVYYLLKNADGMVLQALIPISEDVQIHIYLKNREYFLDFIPIIYTTHKKTLVLAVQKSPYQDILEYTGDVVLANEFVNIYRKSIDFKKFMLKNDKIAMIYTRKYRLGRTFWVPEIKAAVVETHKKSNYLFGYNESFYDLSGREVMGFLLDMPVKYTRISSRFSYGRFHPVLKKTRPHYGVDLAAPHGTVIKAAASGKIIYSGYRGGYGNVVEIAHGDGIRTLYAHMSKRDAKARVGAMIKKGQIIGRVGSTGMSTGPHLHFGVYKNSRPIDPMGIVRTAKNELKGNKKREFINLAKSLQSELDRLREVYDFEVQKAYLETKALD